MSVSAQHLRRALERPPAPPPFLALRPTPPPAPRRTHYPNTLPPVPWIVRGDNALAIFALVIVAALLALWVTS